MFLGGLPNGSFTSLYISYVTLFNFYRTSVQRIEASSGPNFFNAINSNLTKMRNAARSPIRSMFRGVTGLFTTATTVYSPRLSRALILQVSLLLFVRSTLESIPLPFTSLLGDTVVPLVLNIFQTSIGIAAISTYMKSDGWFASIGRRLFAPSESAFISLYATFVLVLGPALALAESAVVVFESMKVARDLEDRMNQVPSQSDSNPWKRIIVLISIVIYSGLIGCAILAYQVNGGEFMLPLTIFGIGSVYFFVSFNADDSNIMEGALLGAYSVVLLGVGIAEELDSQIARFSSLFTSGLAAPPKGEYRALILIVSSAGALLSLPRIPELLQVVLFSAETAEAQIQRADLASPVTPMVLAPVRAMTAAVPPLSMGSQEVAPAQVVLSHFGESTGKLKTSVTMTVSVVVVTFRVLVWSGSLRAGEYYPILSRIAQLLMTLVVYCVFLKMEAADNEEKQRHRASLAAHHSKVQ